MFHYKHTCPVISSLESRPITNRPGLEARLYLKHIHIASDRVASIQGRLESRLVTERLAQKAKMKHVRYVYNETRTFIENTYVYRKHVRL